MAGTNLVAVQPPPRVGEAGGLLRNTDKEGTHTQESSSGGKEVAALGDLGRLQHIPKEAAKGEDCGRGWLMRRPVTARAEGQAG